MNQHQFNLSRTAWVVWFMIVLPSGIILDIFTTVHIPWLILAIGTFLVALPITCMRWTLGSYRQPSSPVTEILFR